MRLHAPLPVTTDGEAANPGPRLRRRGPISEEAHQRRFGRWLGATKKKLDVSGCFAGDEVFTVVHINIRGWLSNNATLYAQLCLLEKFPELVVVNESKLNKSVQRPALAGYELVARKDNPDKQHGGGVLVFADCKLASQMTYMGKAQKQNGLG